MKNVTSLLLILFFVSCNKDVSESNDSLVLIFQNCPENNELLGLNYEVLAKPYTVSYQEIEGDFVKGRTYEIDTNKDLDTLIIPCSGSEVEISHRFKTYVHIPEHTHPFSLLMLQC